MKRFVPRLTYANVMATTAVFIALGGASYAAIKLPKNSVGAKQLKKGAVTPAKLSKASEAALTGPKGARGEPGPKGDKGEPGTPATVLWAVVKANGTLAHGKDISTTGKLGTGEYYVEFYQKDISQCDWQTSLGNAEGDGTANLGMISSALRETNGGHSIDPESLYIRTDDAFGNAADESFHLAIFC